MEHPARRFAPASSTPSIVPPRSPSDGYRSAASTTVTAAPPEGSTSTIDTSPRAAAASVSRRSPSRSWKDGLRLGITRSAVELEHPRTEIGGQHQTRVEQPDERAPTLGELGENRKVHRHSERVGLGCVDPEGRRVRAHPTGVRPLVAVVCPLEVLCRHERRAMRPSQIAKSDTSGPSRSSSARMSVPDPASARIASSTSACVRQTKTPFLRPDRPP